MPKRLCLVLAPSLGSCGPPPDDLSVYTLYRSPLVGNHSIHVGTFDALDGGAYNKENCEIVADLCRSSRACPSSIIVTQAAPTRTYSNELHVRLLPSGEGPLPTQSGRLRQPPLKGSVTSRPKVAVKRRQPRRYALSRNQYRFSAPDARSSERICRSSRTRPTSGSRNLHWRQHPLAPAGRSRTVSLTNLSQCIRPPAGGTGPSP